MKKNLRDLIRNTIYEESKKTEFTFGEVLDTLIDCIASIIIDKGIDLVKTKEIEPDKMADFVNENIDLVIQALPKSSQGILDWYLEKTKSEESK